MARVGARFQDDLDRRVFDAVIRKSAVAPDVKTNGGLADLEAVQRLISSPVLMAAFDLPWTPIFFAAIFIFHPLLGWLALLGAAILVTTALLNQIFTRKRTAEAASRAAGAARFSRDAEASAEYIWSQGMGRAIRGRWEGMQAGATSEATGAAHWSGSFTSFSKATRFFLQSAILAVGAYLVLRNQLTAGAMIAASILLGRALAPVEQSIGSWALVQRARQARSSLAKLLAAVPERPPHTELPAPEARLVVKNLTVIARRGDPPILRGVGFELSPVLWRKVSRGNSLSAGRVQSVAVKILVEREREIINFDSDTYYRIQAVFHVEGSQLKADCPTKFKTLEEARSFLEDCRDGNFSIGDVTVKPGKRTPAPPFTTSTLQQEASRKLSFSVAKTMSVAQRLYENGFITYMRTDSVNLSKTALGASKNMIEQEFGQEYAKTRTYKTKSSGAQEAHEAIRPTYFEKKEVDGSGDEQRLYELIWKRTVASQMADAELERTTIKIDLDKRKENFNAKGEVIKFDGFLKLYIESTDDDDQDKELEGVLPPVKVGDPLSYQQIVGTQRFTNPPYRFTEASLVKKLEELGIGRPSTYAPTINTIQKRGYVVKETRDGKKRKIDQLTLTDGSVKEAKITETYENERNKLFPTDLGMVVTDFLQQHFPTIMDYSFTAEIEEDFDEIAEGKQKWSKLVDNFYKPFHETIEDTTENAERATGERILGEDPKSGRTVLVRIGRFGPIAQIGTKDDGHEELQFASLLPAQHLETITLDEAMELFKLPRVLGEMKGEPLKANIGRFGPYVQLGRVFASIKEPLDPHTITLEEATTVMEEKLELEAKKHINSFQDGEIQVLNGRWGPYIKKGRQNFKIPKDKEAESLTLEDCLEIIETAPAKKKKSRKKKK